MFNDIAVAIATTTSRNRLSILIPDRHLPPDIRR